MRIVRKIRHKIRIGGLLGEGKEYWAWDPVIRGPMKSIWRILSGDWERRVRGFRRWKRMNREINREPGSTDKEGP